MVGDPRILVTSCSFPHVGSDYYGVRRLGDNRHANSIIKAVDRRRVWIQTVHDLWDYDNAARRHYDAHSRWRRGPACPAEDRHATVLNRETGEPIAVEGALFPEHSGEEAAATQPFLR